MSGFLRFPLLFFLPFILCCFPLNKVKALPPPEGLCLEKIGNGAYLNMVPHPDGSQKAFFSNQEGKVWLATIPDEGFCNGILELNESKPFLDISDEVLFGPEHGLMGMAFHPNFVQNGRFFISYNCDKMTNPGCSGRCSCNTDVNCDPSKLGTEGGIQPCQYHTVVAEFTSNQTKVEPFQFLLINFSQVRRIFTLAIPDKDGHAGQIIFGPKDGYLYLMTSDGYQRDDPYNFAQNKKSLLGKILRIDIDNIPSTKEIHKRVLWGNYSIPKDNPYIDDNDLEPEIWALGFSNPWRCSFDSERPSYFLCGDSGQDKYEEVDIIKKGGNYGWRVYEGSFLFHPTRSPGGNTSAKSIKPIFPVMGYTHSQINSSAKSASIIGGYFYRSLTDPCFYGRYLFTDLYAGAIWAGTESPENSGNFTTATVPFRCAYNSPIQCETLVASVSHSVLGYVFSWGEDNKKDVYILASTGVYRVTRPSRCNLTCAKESKRAKCETRKDHHVISNVSIKLLKGGKEVNFLIFFLLFLLGFHLGN
ncbi:HIPL1 protein-like [Humulus lupulus]|uniref:HIPL1 protein-like n=1 Tax=Humulus lupulus TaxID=3486 RepID=UPI002B410D4D|nr:HIPL1 protein-like [Humulus lupulus]